PDFLVPSEYGGSRIDPYVHDKLTLSTAAHVRSYLGVCLFEPDNKRHFLPAVECAVSASTGTYL
ncbi:hypothetical protein EDB60_108198, partial [Vibrio crassostreae]